MGVGQAQRLRGVVSRNGRAARLLDAPHLPIAGYLAFIGAASLISGPTREMRASLPEWLNLAWSIALVVGAVLIVWGVASDRTRAESSGHMFHLFGVLMFAAVHVLSSGSSIVAILALAAVSLLRMRVLARSREARREAGAILRGER